MASPHNHFQVQYGIVPSRNFSPSCESGDWEFFDIIFPRPFEADPVRVFLCGNNHSLPRGDRQCAAVAIARDVTRAGFTLAARNSDCSRGSCGFNWIAIYDAGKPVESPVSIKTGFVHPVGFERHCLPWDWHTWNVRFSTMFNDLPVVFSTANSLGVRDSQVLMNGGNIGRAFLNPAVVGLTQEPTLAGFTLAGRNSDCGWGNAGFYYAAFSLKPAGDDELLVEAGEVLPRLFWQACSEGDWQEWLVYFETPFLIPPVVILTANNLNVPYWDHNPAVVGVVRDVTTHYFTLAARNSDCAGGPRSGVFGQTWGEPIDPSGLAGLYWLALGYPSKCG